MRSNGRYVYVGGTAARLIDELKGTRVSMPGSGPGFIGPGFGGPFTLFVPGGCKDGDCGPARVYSLTDGTSQTIPTEACLPDQTECDYGPVGANWVAITESCYHCVKTMARTGPGVMA